MTSPEWLTTNEFAALARVDVRAARRIAGRSLQGTHWNGARLEVRTRDGRGGAGGTRYEFAVASLPDQLKRRMEALAAGGEKAATVGVAWSEHERVLRQIAFEKLPGRSQDRARRNRDLVVAFHELAPSLPARERQSIVAKRMNVSASTVERSVKRCIGLDPADWLLALQPAYESTAEPAEIDPEAWAFIEYEYFEKATQQPLKQIYEIAKERWPSLPSYHTILRRVNAEPEWRHVQRRGGSAALKDLYPAQQRDYSSLKVNQIWCADGHRCDVVVKFPDGEIARPMLVLWEDVRSRRVMGYAISKQEDIATVRRSFVAASRGAGNIVPSVALMDNGRAFAAKQVTGGSPNRYRFRVEEGEVVGFLTELGVVYQPALPYSGRSKPVESLFRIFARAARHFDGAYVGNTVTPVPENFDKMTKAIPLERWAELVRDTVERHNRRAHRGDAMGNRSPNAVYEELIKGESLRVRRVTERQLEAVCRVAVRIDEPARGVKILRTTYWSASLAELRPGEYTAKYDPEDLNKAIWLYRGREYLFDVPMFDRRARFDDEQKAREFAKGKRELLRSFRDQQAARARMRRALLPSDAPRTPLGSAPASAAGAQPKIAEVVKLPYDVPRHPDQDQSSRREREERRTRWAQLIDEDAAQVRRTRNT